LIIELQNFIPKIFVYSREKKYTLYSGSPKRLTYYVIHFFTFRTIRDSRDADPGVRPPREPVNPGTQEPRNPGTQEPRNPEMSDNTRNESSFLDKP
jgi:hypothetical protein